MVCHWCPLGQPSEAEFLVGTVGGDFRGSSRAFPLIPETGDLAPTSYPPPPYSPLHLCCTPLPPVAKEPSPFFLFNFKIYFIYLFFWLHWVFVAVRGLSLVASSGGYSSLRCAGFSLWWLLLLQSMGSRCVGFSSCGLRVIERRLGSCRAWGLVALQHVGSSQTRA